MVGVARAEQLHDLGLAGGQWVAQRRRSEAGHGGGHAGPEHRREGHVVVAEVRVRAVERENAERPVPRGTPGRAGDRRRPSDRPARRCPGRGIGHESAGRTRRTGSPDPARVWVTRGSSAACCSNSTAAAGASSSPGDVQVAGAMGTERRRSCCRRGAPAGGQGAARAAGRPRRWRHAADRRRSVFAGAFARRCGATRPSGPTPPTDPVNPPATHARSRSGPGVAVDSVARFRETRLPCSPATSAAPAPGWADVRPGRPRRAHCPSVTEDATAGAGTRAGSRRRRLVPPPIPPGAARAPRPGHGTPWVLRRCALGELDARGVDLTGITLDRCHAERARLHGTVLDGARITGARWWPPTSPTPTSPTPSSSRRRPVPGAPARPRRSPTPFSRRAG